MILSNVNLQEALDNGRLLIEPEPLPRRRSPGQTCPYGTHSVDLTLGQRISIPQSGKYAFDPTRQEDLADFISKISNKVTLTPDSSFLLEKNKFVLGNTAEKIHLPIPADGNNCLAARIEGKSSMARLGLLVHFTAPTVHPGFVGTLTLEMINLGPVGIILRPGMPIAQLIVEEVHGLPFSNPSQFQGQTRPEGAV
jgi:dCTP deaminase